MGLDAKKRNRRFWGGFAQPLRLLVKPPHLGEREFEGISPGKNREKVVGVKALPHRSRISQGAKALSGLITFQGSLLSCGVKPSPARSCMNISYISRWVEWTLAQSLWYKLRQETEPRCWELEDFIF